MALANGKQTAVNKIKEAFGYSKIEDAKAKASVESLAEDIVDAVIALIKEGDIDQTISLDITNARARVNTNIK